MEHEERIRRRVRAGVARLRRYTPRCLSRGHVARPRNNLLLPYTRQRHEEASEAHPPQSEGWPGSGATPLDALTRPSASESTLQLPHVVMYLLGSMAIVMPSVPVARQERAFCPTGCLSSPTAG